MYPAGSITIINVGPEGYWKAGVTLLRRQTSQACKEPELVRGHGPPWCKLGRCVVVPAVLLAYGVVSVSQYDAAVVCLICRLKAEGQRSLANAWPGGLQSC